MRAILVAAGTAALMAGHGQLTAEAGELKPSQQPSTRPARQGSSSTP
jgi:hypothetical protein